MGGFTDTSTSVILGIDLGRTGAFALLDSTGKLLHLKDYPGSAEALYEVTRIPGARPDLAVMEDVHAVPGDARRLTSFGKLMQNQGIWLGVLAALDIAVHMVAPLKWQNAIFPKETAGTDSKIRSVELARKLFPGHDFKKSHHNRTDALLIALYGVRYWRSVDGAKGAVG